MAVTTKKKGERLIDLIRERTAALVATLYGRELKNAKEGAGKGHWVRPEELTFVDKDTLSLNISDLKSVLIEISKIK
jgi:hypothetical protein